VSRSARFSSVGVAEILRRFEGRRIVVVGDAVLDEHLVGRATRLSREAPVPVLELVERSWRPGAATNAATNVAALGGRPVMVGIVGADGPGQRLHSELDRASVDPAGLVELPDRTTATKTRILATHASAHPQQVARIDDLPAGPISDTAEQEVVRRIDALVPSADAVLVSNYRGGVVTPRVVTAVTQAAGRRGVPTCVDTQGDLLGFRGFTLIKSNQPDAESALGDPFRCEDDFQRAGVRLLGQLGARYAVITRGSEGMSVVGTTGQHTHLAPTNRTDVWDVTGAGDTVIAVLALGLAAQVDLVDAAELANAAAGLVVRRIGVATVTATELLAAFGDSTPPLPRATRGSRAAEDVGGADVRAAQRPRAGG
jgi:D-glycero-beta-D-manno-heptose-7-phosphate kinase